MMEQRFEAQPLCDGRYEVVDTRTGKPTGRISTTRREANGTAQTLNRMELSIRFQSQRN